MVASFFIDFPTNSKQDSRPDCDGLHDNLRYVPEEDIFKLSASAAANEFYECVQVRIYIYVYPSS